MPQPAFPPAFQAVALDRDADPFARAVRRAPRGLDHGTVYWSDRGDVTALALALEPRAPLAEALEEVYALTVAAGDALAGTVLPGPALAYAWPGRVVLGEAPLGRVRAAAAPVTDARTVPPWLVLGLELAHGSPHLAEAVLRRLLSWRCRAREEGPGPLRAAWNARCFRRGEMASLALAGVRHVGEVAGLDDAGRFVIGDAALPLAAALPELG